MEENKEIQREALQISLLDGKLQEIEQQAALLEKQINELQLCQLALDDINHTKPGTEMLSAVSPGVFVKTELKNNSEFLINTGAKIFCKKNLKDAKEFVQKKLDESLELYNNLTLEMNSIIGTMQSLQQEIIKQRK